MIFTGQKKYVYYDELCSNFLGILKSRICSASWNNTAKVKYTYKDEQHFSMDIVNPYINLIRYLSCTPTCAKILSVRHKYM